MKSVLNNIIQDKHFKAFDTTVFLEIVVSSQNWAPKQDLNHLLWYSYEHRRREKVNKSCEFFHNIPKILQFIETLWF